MEDTGMSKENKMALEIISLVGITISLVALVFVMLPFLMFKCVFLLQSLLSLTTSVKPVNVLFLCRKIRRAQSQKVLFNLAVSLAIFNLLFVISAQVPLGSETCAMAGALLHYFLLVAFGWMLVEGVISYLKFVKVFDTHVERFTRKILLPTWSE